jgi:Rab3 GTPase-activating protein catalytic subunit
VVASLFTAESSNASWRAGSSMGHLLNGHEPISREVILFSPSNSDFEEHQPEQLYSHRMYVHGTLNEVQVAHVAISTD